MAQQPKTGAAQSSSMSEFLAKARKLAEVKPITPPPPKGQSRNYGAATKKQWSRTPEPAPAAEEADPEAQDETAEADGPEDRPDKD